MTWSTTASSEALYINKKYATYMFFRKTNAVTTICQLHVNFLLLLCKDHILTTVFNKCSIIISHAGYCPSSSWSLRTNPNIWESDTTLTAYLPPSGCRIVQRNRCPPNHPVLGMTSGISDKRINIVATLSRYLQLKSIEMYHSAMMAKLAN
jgi:hypothetical protein